MTKQEEIKRFKDLSSEPDSYLSLLLNGFEDQFAEMVKNDEVYSISSMLEVRDKEIVIWADALERKRLTIAFVKENVEHYLELIKRAGANQVAIDCFIAEIKKLIEDL